MNRYWVRITIGALLVFGLGMTAMVGVRKGKAEVRSLLATVGSRLPLQLGNLRFRLEGRRIGEITGLDLQRTGISDPGKVTMRVQLNDGADLDAVRDCTLAVDDLRHLGDGSGFRCADPGELGNGWVKMGVVTFEPGAVARPLYLPQRDVDRWQNGELRSLDASLARTGHGGVTAKGSFDVMDRESGSQRGTFNLQADSDGAVISVRDDQGRALVNFRADHNGVNLNVRDRHGHNLVRLLADSLGAALHIDKNRK
jgi:hypothetical protein